MDITEEKTFLRLLEIRVFDLQKFLFSNNSDNLNYPSISFARCYHVHFALSRFVAFEIVFAALVIIYTCIKSRESVEHPPI